MLVSLTLAGPMLLLTVIVGIAFSLLLVFFRASYLDFWGTVLCVVMMSISSLFYIIMAQWFFGKMLKLVPLVGLCARPQFAEVSCAADHRRHHLSARLRGATFSRDAARGSEQGLCANRTLEGIV